MKNWISVKSFLYAGFIALILISCENRMLEHYETPSWLKGSAWDVLEQSGSYTLFLKGAELAGYKPMMKGKGIITVMAPGDEAFNAYLKQHGYSNVEDIDLDELKKVIGFHLLYYSYNKDRMVNFRPEGDLATDEDKTKNAGLYYKFRTYSSNKATQEIDPATGKHRTVYHLDRFIPVFSYLFFQTKGIDAKTNYEYFYPESTWTGNDGFNVSNASVKEYGIIADNGYIHAVDKVLEPLETIHTVLKEKENFSEFLNLYDSYTSYEYDKTLSDDYKEALGVDSLFLHKHGSLPPIAMEWPVSSFQNIKILSSVSYSVFALSNNALNDFFNQYWSIGEYESLYDLDPLIVRYLLFQYIYGGSIVFPEEIKNGKIKNSFGTLFNFDPFTLKEKAMCINGSFYGIEEMDTPPLFESVVGPAFRDKQHISFLYALDGSSLINSYVSSDVQFTMLIPSEEQINSAGIFLNSYTTGNALEIETEEGWTNLGTARMQDIVNMHTVSGGEGLVTNGSKVYATQQPFNFWFVKDGEITSNALFNKIIEPDYVGTPFVKLEEITNNGQSWKNGKAYRYVDDEKLLFDVESSDGLAHALAISNDARYPYNSFAQLLKNANMISGSDIIGLFTGRFIAFIPTNTAISEALSQNKIPGIVNGSINSDGQLVADEIDPIRLQQYLNSYFLRSQENVITTYPYIGSAMKSGVYTSMSGSKLTYTDNGTILSIQTENGVKVNVISTYDYFPFAYSDGCFHLIESIL